MKQKSRWSLSRSLSQGDKMALADSPKDFGVCGREARGGERGGEKGVGERKERGIFHSKKIPQ